MKMNLGKLNTFSDSLQKVKSGLNGTIGKNWFKNMQGLDTACFWMSGVSYLSLYASLFHFSAWHPVGIQWIHFCLSWTGLYYVAGLKLSILLPQPPGLQLQVFASLSSWTNSWARCEDSCMLKACGSPFLSLCIGMRATPNQASTTQRNPTPTGEA